MGVQLWERNFVEVVEGKSVRWKGRNREEETVMVMMTVAVEYEGEGR